MTQQEKDLLLKDLCTRLPYGVKVKDTYYNSLEPAPIWLIDINAQKVRMFADEGYQSIEYIKPYLFPMSSMTEEQKNVHDTLVFNINFIESGRKTVVKMLFEFYLKNHIDYDGLIEKGLANDATGLNIY
jgi:hypothetical protein